MHIIAKACSNVKVALQKSASCCTAYIKQEQISCHVSMNCHPCGKPKYHPWEYSSMILGISSSKKGNLCWMCWNYCCKEEILEKSACDLGTWGGVSWKGCVKKIPHNIRIEWPISARIPWWNKDFSLMDWKSQIASEQKIVQWTTACLKLEVTCKCLQCE